jgi:hypothetical protein
MQFHLFIRRLVTLFSAVLLCAPMRSEGSGSERVPGTAPSAIARVAEEALCPREVFIGDHRPRTYIDSLQILSLSRAVGESTLTVPTQFDKVEARRNRIRARKENPSAILDEKWIQSLKQRAAVRVATERDLKQVHQLTARVYNSHYHLGMSETTELYRDYQRDPRTTTWVAYDPLDPDTVLGTISVTRDFPRNGMAPRAWAWILERNKKALPFETSFPRQLFEAKRRENRHLIGVWRFIIHPDYNGVFQKLLLGKLAELVEKEGVDSALFECNPLHTLTYTNKKLGFILLAHRSEASVLKQGSGDKAPPADLLFGDPSNLSALLRSHAPPVPAHAVARFVPPVVLRPLLNFVRSLNLGKAAIITLIGGTAGILARYLALETHARTLYAGSIGIAGILLRAANDMQPKNPPLKQAGLATSA